jgi:glycosyltransferase involved in cell wall biosynthesis
MKAAHAEAVPVRIAHSHTTSGTAHTVARRAYRALSRKLIAQHSTALAACSREAGLGLFGSLWSDGAGQVIPNGVDVERFAHVRDQRETSRERLGLAPGQTAIGMIARLVDPKNHDFMLDVIGLDRANAGSRVLLIIGEGPLRSVLERRVEELAISDRVRFLGLRDDVPDILGALDFVVLPSKHEGLPVTVVEAQAAGVPALVSDRVTRESDLGLGTITWLPLDDPREWLRALHVETPRPAPSEVRARFAAAGYDIQSSAAKLLALYADHRGRQ